MVLADCDVDAADLHLILQPEVLENHSFAGGLTAQIDSTRCAECGQCRELCRFDAISEDLVIDPLSCEGCGVCADNCPEEAISMNQEIAGEWFVSISRFGPLVHAKLGIAQENSGKLVSKVRDRAKEIATEQQRDLIVIDGPPGIGCPVISAITGSDLVLVVTEPTVSGRHDLERVLDLTQHFNIPAAVCINKYDLNEELADKIRNECTSSQSYFVGEVPYDPMVTKAMVSGKTIMENGNCPAASRFVQIWDNVIRLLTQIRS